MTDVLELLIKHIPDMPLKVLSIQAAVSEESLKKLLSGQVFQGLTEIVRIKDKYLTMDVAKIRKFCAGNKMLKKVNMRGCCISSR